MSNTFSGCWNIAVTATELGGVEEAARRVIVAGAMSGNGTYGLFPGTTLHVEGIPGQTWSLTVEGQIPGGWTAASVQTTNGMGGTVILAADTDDDTPRDPRDPMGGDVVLTCTPCTSAINPKQLEQWLGTWVSWGVMVDAGGPTGHGPVPPWTGPVRELAVGLALADTARLVRSDLRAGVLNLAAQQVGDAAASIVKAIKSATNA
jgi:hypothetical protein